MTRCVWPCRISSAPCSATTASNSRASSSPRNRGALPPRIGGWWIITTRARPAVSFSRRREGVELGGAEPAGGEQRPGRHAAVEADQRDFAATAQIGKAIALGPRREGPLQRRQRVAHIGVVIAGRVGDVGLVPERAHPGGGALELGAQREIDGVAGHGDVIGRMGAQVGDDAGERLHVVDALARALPVDPAEESLQPQFAPGRKRRRAQMRVGEMRDRETHGAQPYSGREVEKAMTR